MITVNDDVLSFTPSEPDSIGLEMEVQLINPTNMDLVDGVKSLLELYPDSERFKPEFIQNTFEVASPVCHRLDELQHSMLELMADLHANCRALDMMICGAGTHPFGRRLALITPLPRYYCMEQQAGYLAHVQVTFATHVHIGMTSGDEAISLMRDIKACLPLLIALSANSPFWRGYDTGYASYRQRILAASRSYGIPPTFRDWEAFALFFQNSVNARVFETINSIHWDIRPRPHLGTLEVRVMDAQTTVHDAVMFAALVRGLVQYLRQIPEEDRPFFLPRALPWWLEKENHFQASRYGLQARCVTTTQGRVRLLVDMVNDLLDELIGVNQDNEMADWLRSLKDHVHTGPGYVRQRQLYADNSGKTRQIVESLVGQLSDEVGSYAVQV